MVSQKRVLSSFHLHLLFFSKEAKGSHGNLWAGHQIGMVPTRDMDQFWQKRVCNLFHGGYCYFFSRVSCVVLICFSDFHSRSASRPVTVPGSLQVQHFPNLEAFL